MYPKEYYKPGKWIDRSWTTHNISDMNLEYLWNCVFFITSNLPYKTGEKLFWKEKRSELLREIDKRARKHGEMEPPPFKRIRGVLE